LGKEILNFEQHLYKNWSSSVVELAQSALKGNILHKSDTVKNGITYSRYSVNYSAELDLLIREAKLLD